MPGLQLEMQPPAIFQQPPVLLPDCLSYHFIVTWVTLVLGVANQSKLMLLPLLVFVSLEGSIALPEAPGQSPTSSSPQVEEMEPRLLEFEQDPPNWRELASPEALSSLSKKETKRQEVINGEEKRTKTDKIMLLYERYLLIVFFYLFTHCTFSLSFRVVCNRACPCANAQCPSGGLL